jgi:hypothetical protein
MQGRSIGDGQVDRDFAGLMFEAPTALHRHSMMR